MSEPAGFGTLALLVERLIGEVQGLRSDLDARKVPAPPTVAGDPEGLLDVKGAAAHCRCSTTTIYRSAERGELRCMRAGARVRFVRADLDAWLRGERPEPGRLLAIKRGG